MEKKKKKKYRKPVLEKADNPTKVAIAKWIWQMLKKSVARK